MPATMPGTSAVPPMTASARRAAGVTVPSERSGTSATTVSATSA